MVQIITPLRMFSCENRPTFKSNHSNESFEKNDEPKITTESALSLLAASGIYIATKNNSKYVNKQDLKPKDINSITIQDVDGKNILTCPTLSEQIKKFEGKTIDIDDFKQNGSLKNKKAKLDNGKDFNGFIEINKTSNNYDMTSDIRTVLEYRDGNLVEATKLIGEDASVKKYENGKLKSVVNYETIDDGLTSRVTDFELYSNKENGARVCTEYNFNENDKLYEVSGIRTVQKSDNSVIIDDVGQNCFGDEYSVHKEYYNN